MKKWKCQLCGHVWESEEKPEKCPACFAPGDNIEEVTEETD